MATNVPGVEAPPSTLYVIALLVGVGDIVITAEPVVSPKHTVGTIPLAAPLVKQVSAGFNVTLKGPPKAIVPVLNANGAVFVLPLQYTTDELPVVVAVGAPFVGFIVNVSGVLGFHANELVKRILAYFFGVVVKKVVEDAFGVPAKRILLFAAL